jgi:hypothetical protein
MSSEEFNEELFRVRFTLAFGQREPWLRQRAAALGEEAVRRARSR